MPRERKCLTSRVSAPGLPPSFSPRKLKRLLMDKRELILPERSRKDKRLEAYVNGVEFKRSLRLNFIATEAKSKPQALELEPARSIGNGIGFQGN